jgi:hypothetical protein
MGNVTSVYLPSLILIFGVAIAKQEWVPYAAAFAAVAGGLKIYLASCAQPHHPRDNHYLTALQHLPRRKS